MAVLHLVRHGHAAARFDADRDPGLDDTGRAQAVQAAAELATKGPLPILVSPLRRCRETAEPLEALWSTSAVVDQAVAEVVSPTDDLAERGTWLREAMAGRWRDLEDPPRRWREVLLARLLDVDTDTVVVTHFIAVNAVLGAASDDDRVVQAAVGPGSCTVVETDGRGFRLIATGGEARSEVL